MASWWISLFESLVRKGRPHHSDTPTIREVHLLRLLSWERARLRATNMWERPNIFSLVITSFYQLADGALVDTYRVVILNIVSDNIDIG